MDALALIAAYYDAFNAGRTDEMLTYLHDDVEHHVNEGGIRRGKDLFAQFNAHMSRCYRERLADITIMATPAGDRAAAEFVVHGTYLATDDGLPEARGQTYVLPAGSFFDIRDGKIARVTTYYNLADWTRQVAA
ncbi:MULTISPECIES: ketosteroid isomerase-related protein [unclassified Paracoccus (in: a-proteobacteria)]|uniref:ketosteroid isomerase-related protein n=1 Tax=unclassified Paracoccus (in: a-proteobacteria) TaxID=2688777 RepID=UPI0012B1E922|nr:MULTISPECIES: ketosteroid isomerase-related protein [unclassified Paracoccus (in: a-proteobacteria)]UXU75122.1 nuclear transport factor 2 family protein [Paracoccus sp. SMMA_5]UXU81025.1 nuclear transport factor 2 family protein [Paracoccus sp. SMMA_5_TC]